MKKIALVFAALVGSVSATAPNKNAQLLNQELDYARQINPSFQKNVMPDLMRSIAGQVDISTIKAVGHFENVINNLHSQPLKSQPSRGQPSRGQPSRGQPSRGQPSRGQPSKGQPSKGRGLKKSNLRKANADTKLLLKKTVLKKNPHSEFLQRRSVQKIAKCKKAKVLLVDDELIKEVENALGINIC